MNEILDKSHEDNQNPREDMQFTNPKTATPRSARENFTCGFEFNEITCIYHSKS
jgi:hypothetical protein